LVQVQSMGIRRGGDTQPSNWEADNVPQLRVSVAYSKTKTQLKLICQIFHFAH